MNFFSEYTALYFFSALLQANAAILAIAGVFFIFRIQTYQSSIDFLKNYLMNSGTLIGPYSVIEFNNLTQEVRKKRIEENEEKKYYELGVIYHLENWIEKHDEILKVKSAIKPPTILLAIGIIINGLGLFFANFIHNSLFANEFIILIIFLIYEIVIIFLVVKGIHKAL